MAKFEEILGNIRKSLEGLTTAENVEATASIAKNIDRLEEEHKSTELELKNSKDALVKYVKETAFNKKPEEDNDLNKVPSLEEAFEEAFKTK